MTFHQSFQPKTLQVVFCTRTLKPSAVARPCFYIMSIKRLFWRSSASGKSTCSLKRREIDECLHHVFNVSLKKQEPERRGVIGTKGNSDRKTWENEFIKWRALKLNGSCGVKLGERGRGRERVKLVIIWTLSHGHITQYVVHNFW